MSPPCYADLGKDAKDIFSKDYKIGLFNFELKSLTSTGSDLKISGSHDIAKSVFASVFESKNKITSGVTSKVKADSKGLLSHELEVSDKLVKNLKQTLITTLQAKENEKMLTLKNAHKSVYHNGELEMQFKEACPRSITSLVISPNKDNMPLFFGLTATLEPRSHTPSKASGSVFYHHKDLQLLASADNKKNVDFSVFHPSSFADLGLKLTWRYETGNVETAFGCMYRPNNVSFIKAKVDDKLGVGLAYGVTLAEGIKMTLSTSLDAKQLHSGEHKLGFSIEASA